jgi:hypothetical protein
MHIPVLPRMQIDFITEGAFLSLNLFCVRGIRYPRTPLHPTEPYLIPYCQQVQAK